MLEAKLSRFAALPGLEITGSEVRGNRIRFHCVKKRAGHEACPRCATASASGYDRRTVRLRDEPLRNGGRVELLVTKLRWYCRACRRPFTEPVPGVLPKQRYTQRFKRALLWAAETFTSLKAVRDTYSCSNGMIYRSVYEQLELRMRMYESPWPKAVGIDEHFFSRARGEAKFFTVFTDLRKGRVREAVAGKRGEEVKPKIAHIEGREGVEWVALDMCDAYRKLARETFPNARLVADKFHVLRLVSPALRRRRIEVTGDRRSLRIRRLLLRNRPKLAYDDRQEVDRWLANYPELNEVYRLKEGIHEFYRIKGYGRAQAAFERLLQAMRGSGLEEVARLRRTFVAWRNEILNYFRSGLTNATTEGFNRIASLVKNRGFGYKNPRNYRLRFLSACRRS